MLPARVVRAGGGEGGSQVRAEDTITIARPCEEVFVTLTNLAAMPAWRANVTSAEWIGEPAAGPAKIRAVTQLLGARFEWDCEVTALDPPARFGYIARSGKQVVEVKFSLEPHGNSCRLTMVGGGQVPGGRLGAVAAPLFVKTLLRENRKSLRTLKALVEDDVPRG